MRQAIPGDPGVDPSLPRSEQMSHLAGTDRLEFPYLPRPSAFPGIVTVPYVVNSVGLSQLRTLSHAESAPARAALREADAVSVRDPLSSRLLEEWGIDHFLAPDIVHILRRQHPLATMTAPVAAIQMRESTIKDLGVRRVATLLCPLPDDLDIRFIAAGTAPGHDSVDAYYAVADVLRQMDRNSQSQCGGSP